MVKFGRENQFEIWVDYFFIKFKETEEFIQHCNEYKSWADVYFFVKGKNIFQLKDHGPEATYQSDLITLVSFLCNNLFYFLTQDDLPVKTKGKNSIEMIEEIKLVPGDDSDLSKWAALDWDNIDMAIRGEIDDWIDRHSFLRNADGTSLPNAYIRRIDSNIEISWKNIHPYRNTSGEFYFKYKNGVDLIEINLFRDTVINFCMDFLGKFKDVYPDLVSEYRLNLQKALDVPLD